MAKKKNMKADKPEFGGCVTFDGNIQVRIPNHGLKTLRTDLGGLALQKANPNKELLVLTRDHVGYDEIDTGYIVRSKRYDDGQPPYFGLKHEPNADSWGCHNYCDVIAWGYADGGLNDPTLYYSCQSTVAEEIEREKWRAEKGMKTHAERLAEMEDENEEYIKAPHGLVMRFRHKDGQIQNGTMWTKDMGPIPEGFQEKLKVTLQDFLEFTKEHPEFKEMHFYTEPTEWEDEDEETEN
jgi:hypothetical protein